MAAYIAKCRWCGDNLYNDCMGDPRCPTCDPPCPWCVEREAIEELNRIEAENLATDPHYYDSQKTQIRDDT